MKKLALSPTEKEVLLEHEARIKGRRGYKRWKSVCLTLVHGKTKEAAATELGIHPRTVETHQKRYRDQELLAFVDTSTGVTGPRLLSAEQEPLFFSKKGKTLKRVRYVERLNSTTSMWLGRSCCLNTIDRG
jgi:transposase